MEPKIKWVNDPAHSEILFKAKHLMITNVKGEFRKFNVEAVSENGNFIADSIKVTIDATSILTNNEDRDKHLKSADFLEVDKHKEIYFQGSSIEKDGEDTFKLMGNMTIRGITKRITLNVEFGGINKDPWGNEKAGFSLNGKINRKDWGLTWNAALESGGVLVSDEIILNAEIQLVKQS